jgi:hypothetical protein
MAARDRCLCCVKRPARASSTQHPSLAFSARRKLCGVFATKFRVRGLTEALDAEFSRYGVPSRV